MHLALNSGICAKHSTGYPRVLKPWIGCAKHWTFSYGDLPISNMLCTGIQTLQKTKSKQQWPTTHGESPQHENHCNAKEQRGTRSAKTPEQNSKTEGSRRVPWTFKFQTIPWPSSKNMPQTNMLWSSAAGFFIWHCHLSHDPWQLHHWIIIIP